MLISGGKTKKTALVMIINLFTTIITSVFSLLITQKILTTLGSDYNGVNSTAAQIVTILGLIEGGFTLAAQVALYKPVAQEDKNRISQLVTYAAKKMRSYGMWTLAVGVIVSAAYACFVKSGLTYGTILSVMVLAVLGAAYNLGVVSQYRILFQVTQTEYKCGYVNIASQFLLYFSICLVLRFTDDIIAVRTAYLLIEVFRGVGVTILAKKNFRDINYHACAGGIELKGTKEVFVAKITTLIYNSAPVLFISTFVGAASASVYALYLSITNIVLSLLTSVANAPTHGLGQLIAEGDDERKRGQLIGVYSEYELLMAMTNSFLCSVTFVMLTPFISLYTRGVTDISYVDEFYTIIMVLILLFQILHMPSGICINVAGKFKALRNIQIVASVFLLVTLVVGVIFGGLKGLLIAKLSTAIVLFVIEIVYNYIKVIRCSLMLFFRVMLTTCLPAVALCLIESNLINNYINVDSWGTCMLLGCAIFVANAICFVSLNFVFNRKIVTRIIHRFIRKPNKNGD